jgi:hypothetical protein
VFRYEPSNEVTGGGGGRPLCIVPIEPAQPLTNNARYTVHVSTRNWPAKPRLTALIFGFPALGIPVPLGKLGIPVPLGKWTAISFERTASIALPVASGQVAGSTAIATASEMIAEMVSPNLMSFMFR